MTTVLRMKNGMTVKKYREKIVRMGLGFIVFVLGIAYLVTYIELLEVAAR
jgi:hypothetical protein